jgi:hypothetical protein
MVNHADSDHIVYGTPARRAPYLSQVAQGSCNRVIGFVPAGTGVLVGNADWENAWLA